MRIWSSRAGETPAADKTRWIKPLSVLQSRESLLSGKHQTCEAMEGHPSASILGQAVLPKAPGLARCDDITGVAARGHAVQRQAVNSMVKPASNSTASISN